MEFMSELFKVGGIFVWGILGCFGFLVFLTLKKVKELWLGQVDSTKVRNLLNESIKNRKFDEILLLAKNYPKSAVAKIVEAGVTRFGRDENHIYHAVSATVSEEVPKIQAGVAAFSFVANISTLFGLLGTITGMISAFKGVASEAAAAKQTLLAEGISEAMHCTASGLFVAVAALVLASIINSRATKLTSDCHAIADKCLEASGARLYQNGKTGTVMNRNVGAA